MMKLLNSVIILVILCGGIHSTNGEVLQCEFQDFTFIWGAMYTCRVYSLDNSKNDKVINSHSGTHLANKNDNDVKAIRIYNTKTKYIPANLGILFNLTAFVVEFSQLVEIKAENFLGMQNLEYLSLWGNQIIYIGSDAFGQLTSLKNVYLSSNICVNKNYEGPIAITQMKEDLEANCLASTERMLFQMENNFMNELKVMKSERQQEHNEITNKVAKASKMNEELIQKIDESQKEFKALNEMIKTLLKASEEHQVEHHENIKLRADLSAAKEEQKMAMDQHKKEQETNIKVTNERDQLKEENADLKETIDQKLPKMEQLIEDFYMEAMDLKIERHNERQNSIALRSKLMEAKEQLAECKINERISC